MSDTAYTASDVFRAARELTARFPDYDVVVSTPTQIEERVRLDAIAEDIISDLRHVAAHIETGWDQVTGACPVTTKGTYPTRGEALVALLDDVDDDWRAVLIEDVVDALTGRDCTVDVDPGADWEHVKRDLVANDEETIERVAEAIELDDDIKPAVVEIDEGAFGVVVTMCDHVECGDSSAFDEDVYGIEVLRGNNDTRHIQMTLAGGGPSAWLVRDFDEDRLQVSWGAKKEYHDSAVTTVLDYIDQAFAC